VGPDAALGIGEITRERDSNKLTDEQRATLAQAFERTLETCELPVSYPVGIAGKPSKQ